MRINIIKHITICDIFVLLYALYQYSDMYIHTSISTLGFYIPLLLIGGYGLFQTTFNNNNQGFIRVLIFFIVFLSVYGLLFVMFGEAQLGHKSTTFLFGNFFSLSPILIFYISTLKNKVDERRMRLYVIVFIVIAYLRYVYIFAVKEVDFDNVSFTNNAAYYFVLSLPCVFLFNKNRLFQYIILLVLLFFIMRGMKRGAIITAGAFLIVFLSYFRKTNKEKNGFFNQTYSLLLLLIAVIALYYFVQNVWFSNDYFQRRLEVSMEGDSSGRDVIYSTLFNHYIYNNNLFQLIFGGGAESSVMVAGIHAHNDWLELLTDCGAMGIILYISYYVSLFRDCNKYKRVFPEVYMIISCGVILLVRSVFSMSYMDMYISMSAVLGYGLAICQKKQKTTLNEKR